MCRARARGPSTQSSTTDANLDCAFVADALVLVVLKIGEGLGMATLTGMEIHLGFCTHRMRPLFKLKYLKSVSTNQQASSQEIWCFELHLALVSCQHPDFSRNGSHLKNSVRKVELC